MTRENVGGWHIVGVSVQGVSHQKADLPCQDAWWAHWLPGMKMVAAVADGAGSAEMAREASGLASDMAVGRIRLEANHVGIPDDESSLRVLLLSAMEVAKEVIEEEARENNHDIRDYATTLLLVMAGPDFVAAAQIGDGAVVIEDETGSIFALTKPQQGEHANETVFLISPNAIEEAEIVVWRGKTKNIAIFSDGLQRLALKMPEGTAFAPFFTPLFKFLADVKDANAAVEQLETFLKSPRITERADDDLTLLLAHRD